MTLSAAAVTGSVAIAADTSSQANNYETYARKTIAGSAILHCFDWSFDEIRDALPEIAAAGYTAVQTSPAQSYFILLDEFHFLSVFVRNRTQKRKNDSRVVFIIFDICRK